MALFWGLLRLLSLIMELLQVMSVKLEWYVTVNSQYLFADYVLHFCRRLQNQAQCRRRNGLRPAQALLPPYSLAVWLNCGSGLMLGDKVCICAKLMKVRKWKIIKCLQNLARHRRLSAHCSIQRRQSRRSPSQSPPYPRAFGLNWSNHNHRLGGSPNLLYKPWL